MLDRVGAVGLGNGSKRIAAGPSGRRGGDAVVQLLGAARGEPPAHVLEAADVGIQRRRPDPEAPREIGETQAVEPVRIGDIGRSAEISKYNSRAVDPNRPRYNMPSCDWAERMTPEFPESIT